MEETQSPVQLCWQLALRRSRVRQWRLPSPPPAAAVPARSVLVTSPRPVPMVLCCRWRGCPTEHSLCHHAPGSAAPPVVPGTQPGGVRRGEHAVVVLSGAPHRRGCPTGGILRVPGGGSQGTRLEHPLWKGSAPSSARSGLQPHLCGSCRGPLPSQSHPPDGSPSSCLAPPCWHSPCSQPRSSPGSRTRMGKKPRGEPPVPLPCAGKPCPCAGGGLDEWGWGGSCNAGVTFGAVLWP